MTDPKIKKLASILVNHSVTAKKGDVVQINAGTELAKPLALEVYKEALKAGAHPFINVGFEEANKIFYDMATKDQLQNFPKIKMFEAENIDCVISIAAPYNKKSMSTVNPAKVGERSKIIRKIRDTIINKKRWVITNFPTHALAQEADMTLPDYEEFLYKATNIDWNKAKVMGNKIKRVLDKGNTVRIVGKDTDLTLNIKGRRSIPCFGERNMPDGETFMSPIEDSAEGKIYYEMPAIYQGREVTGIRLTFRKGKVVEARADKNEAFLNAMLDTDKGGRYLGELGIGFNYGIQKFTKDILFDEKIGGTVHLAVGKSYEEVGGKNVSAIHWDMIKDLRQGGAIYIDGKAIQKNGKFLI
ncbi:MAG: aminopeptidase [Deltaproteobacteria bacterium]|nr:aminopeptidase [Deltaproteobacteria bacterium]